MPKEKQVGIILARVVENLLVEALSPLSYDDRVAIVYPAIQEIGSYDWLTLPDGTTFEKTFSPKKRNPKRR